MKYVIKKSILNNDVLVCSTQGAFTVYKYSANPSGDLYNYRSIITHENKVVCFSPPKSIDRTCFLELYSSKDVVVEEYIEGTMVNAFWVDEENGWKFASRSKIDANCVFFNTNGHFSTMVEETFAECKLDLNALNKDYCYSFVIQHPNNRIVTKFESIQLYLIAAYKIEEDAENDDIYIHSIDDVQTDPVWATTSVKFPATILNFNLNATSDSLNMPYTQMGVVFKSGGGRCKLRNPAYEYVRQLRGNQPKLLYRYLELRKLGKIREFLNYFPEHTEQFAQFRANVHEYTNALYNLYVRVYILKNETDPQARNNFRFKVSLHALHHMYQTQQVKINISKVIEYVNSLPEAVLMTII
jgi:hypothetical protein